jgi:hypothetical protein
LNDDPQKHRGRSRTSHIDENCVIVEGLIKKDQRVKVHETAEVAGIAKSTAHKIISDLNFCKVSALWVQKMLTEEHKSTRMAASFENFCRYQNEGELFMESIMGDETCVYELTPKSKRNSMTQKHRHSPTTKKFKIQPPAKKKKTMATAFWDCEGLLLCEFLPPKTTNNSDKYCKTLEKLSKAINERDQE